MRQWAWVLAGAMVGGCGAVDVPRSELATAEQAVAEAVEHGAEDDLSAALYLTLARRALGDARARLAVGDGSEARRLCVRAAADAEMATLVAREASLRDAARRTWDEASLLADSLTPKPEPP